MYQNLNNFIEVLEKHDELVRIKTAVSPILEMTEINDRIVKSNGKALLFENTDTGFPVLLNAFGSEKRMCLALGVEDLSTVGNEMQTLFDTFTAPQKTFFQKVGLLPKLSSLAGIFPKVKSGKGSCQEVVMDTPDLSKLPVLQCWPHDGGRFITLPIVHTEDPLTGVRNVGMYRMQILGKDQTGMHWHIHKNSARHFREYKRLNKRMPVTVTLGGDPIYTYAATAPLPDNIDEYIFAGFMRKKKVEMVKCMTNDLTVPADCDFVIEGYIDPNEELVWEGPFGDHTGFYSLEDFYPRFHITCITHKRNAVYPATVVGIPPQEDKWLGIATERIFFTPLKMAVMPELLDMCLPAEGGFHNLVIVKIKKEYPGQARKVMNAIWGAGLMMLSKNIIVVDESVDIKNSDELLAALNKNVDLAKDLCFAEGPLDALDHSANQFAFGSKLGIDATRKLPEEKQYQSETVLDFEKKNLPAYIYKSNTISNFIEVVSVMKTEESMIDLHQNALSYFPHRKYVVILDQGANINNLNDIVWLVTHNTDPKRDFKTIGNKILLIDGTRKNKQQDNFPRRWPNSLAMDTHTIEKIDTIWKSLGLGAFIPSPSISYQKLVRSNSAAIEE